MSATINRSWALYGAIVLSVICLAVLSRFPQPKAIESAKNGIDLNNKIESWGPDYCARLGFALGFDFLFIDAYVTAIGLGCATVATDVPGLLGNLGIILAYAQVASGFVDAIENVSLIRLLIFGFEERLMSVARLATALKFVVPVAGLLYILAVWRLRKV